jgi:polyvinyl alcohol dehydrogenase (cytochrome)
MRLATFVLSAPVLVWAQAVCPPDRPPRTDSSFWNGWGVDAVNSRFQPAAMARLGAAEVPRLKLKWAYGIPNANAAVAQPVVVGGVLYFGSMDGTIHAVDAGTGCVYWTFRADATVRAAMTVAAIQSGRYALLFGDVKAQVYALDIPSRTLRWKTKVDDHRYARITGAPKLHEGKLYVPVSSTEEVPAGNPKYECCTFRGSVVALDEQTGKIAWKTYTVAEPSKPARKSEAGTQLHGPAGGAVWNSPTIDAARGVLYVGTGNGYTDPSAPTTDSLLALDLKTGALRWHVQLDRDDNWTFACVNPRSDSCPKQSGPDFDFGASPILRGNLLIAGQKSGMVHAVDVDAKGQIVWQTRVGKGSALGGVLWGMAADAVNVYVPLSDQVTPAPGGMFALRIGDGERMWHTAPPTRSAQMAPATAIPGVVFSGAMDGHMRAYSTEDGKVLWDFDTRREFETVNGVKAKGGSLNATGAVVAGGMVFVNSGYGILGGVPGNVLLAFAPE